MKTNQAADLYLNVPPEQRRKLEMFRASHPYHQLTVGGVRWEYIASGQGPETLLILGGAMALGETAFQTISRLEQRLRVISPSYPAQGKARVVANGLAAILDAEGVSKAHVSGHSLGAGVAHVFTRLCPERVAKLVIDGFGLYTPRHTRIAKLFFKLPYGVLIAYYRRVIKRLLGTSTDPEILFWSAYLEELLTRLHTRESLLAQFHLLFDIFDEAEQYGVFKPVHKPGEVLLILAKDDRGFSDIERQALIDSYPGAQVNWFESGGHLSGFTQREAFNRHFDQFMFGRSPEIEPKKA